MAKIEASYALERLARAPEVLGGDQPVAFIRHDIDVSLERARELATLEKSWGIAATYHVMLSCPFYDVTAPSSRQALAAIREAGHEIGLHYHPAHDESASPPHAADEEIAAACTRLEDVLDAPVKSVSFHLPSPGLIGGPLFVAGRVNAYAAPLLGWYLSDSQARWREGEPMQTLDTPRGRVLQILVHPLWWGEHHEIPTFRLARLVKDLATERSGSFEAIAEMVQKHILVFPTLPPPR
jgi:hypothetical protein